MASAPLFNLRLDDALRARVRAAAVLRGCTQSEVVRDLIRRARPEELVIPSPALVGAEAPEAKAEPERIPAAR